MADRNRRSSVQSGRNNDYTGSRQYNDNNKNYKYYNNNRNNNYFWAIALFLFLPIKPSFANTTVASPNSTAQGVVNNNATMITPSSLPQNRYSQGITCTSPSMTITPYLTDSWSFNRPIEEFTYQEIYDENTGAVKYTTKTPRFEKDNYNLNYGISMQFNIPLGKGGALCHEAAKVNIEAQELLITKTKYEISLYRLKLCSEQAKLGVYFKPNSPSAITCQDIVVSTPPNQVLPHNHKIMNEKEK